MRRHAPIAALACLAIAVAGCGERHEVVRSHGVQPLSLMLDFPPNADHVGLYKAIHDGLFRLEGLNLTVKSPPSPSAPLSFLAAGKVDIAISYEPELMLARARGLDLISVAAITQGPLTSIIALGSKHITTIGQLRGKTVGTADIPYQAAELQTILQAAKVPPASVRQIPVGFDLVKAMLTGKVDATIGGFRNYEAVQLARAGKHPTVIPVDRAGVPTYDELVVVVRPHELQDKPQLIRAFLHALGQGYQRVRGHPAAGVDALIAENRNLGLDRGLQRAAVRQTMKLFFPADPTKPFGYQNIAQWNAFGSWMFQHKLLPSRPRVSQVVTNDLLPGQGE